MLTEHAVRERTRGNFPAVPTANHEHPIAWVELVSLERIERSRSPIRVTRTMLDTIIRMPEGNPTCSSFRLGYVNRVRSVQISLQTEFDYEQTP
jgi:hypothetical protein